MKTDKRSPGMKIIISILMTLSLFVSFNVLYAQGVIGSETKKKGLEIDTSQAHLLVLVGSGVFSPASGMLDTLKPSWNVKLLVQYNRIANIAGAGIEIMYSALPDREYDYSEMHFIPIIPHFTLTFSLFSIIDLQPRLGVGMTVLYTRIRQPGQDSIDRVSAEFTASLGVSVMRTFFRHLTVGVDFTGYYFFEKDSSLNICVNGFVGAKF
ncbi:hypothetical protein ACFL20_11240 [Spirochaetota bacterium]